MADVTINGVSFRLAIVGAPHPDAAKLVNAVELLSSAPWSSVRDLVGYEVPGIGVVVGVGAPRVDPLPVGARINLVTLAPVG